VNKTLNRKFGSFLMQMQQSNSFTKSMILCLSCSCNLKFLSLLLHSISTQQYNGDSVVIESNDMQDAYSTRQFNWI
jgi:hypothetical protein